MRDLEAKLPQLMTMETKINNLVALRERLEALQERELEPIPNYLNELIPIHDNTNTTQKQDSYKNKLRQMIDKHQPKNLRLGMTIVFSVLISWGTASVVINNHKTETNLLSDQIEELKTRLEQLESEAAPDNL